MISAICNYSFHGMISAIYNYRYYSFHGMISAIYISLSGAPPYISMKSWNRETQRRSEKTDRGCEMFTQDENSTSCEHCGGTWHLGLKNGQKNARKSIPKWPLDGKMFCQNGH
jgi:hypothetical protein